MYLDLGVNHKVGIANWAGSIPLSSTDPELNLYTKSDFWSLFVQVNLNWLSMQNNQNLHILNSLLIWFRMKFQTK